MTTSGERVLGSPYLGLPVASLPLGFNPPCLLENDILAGDAAGTLYEVYITSWPSAGNMYVNPDSSFTFLGAPDGFYSGGQGVRKYDPANGLITDETTTYSITVGSGVDTTPPTFTGTLVVNSITTSSAVVNWAGTVHTDNVGITGYDWSLNGTSWAPTGSTATSRAFSGLSDDTDYTVYIRARDAAGNISSALSQSFRTLAAGGTPGIPEVSADRAVDFDGGINRVNFDGGINRVNF
jgi:hypothetical protein